jgi:hypothetical protein
VALEVELEWRIQKELDLESENEALRFKVALVKEKGSRIASAMSALSTVAQLFNSPAQPDNQQAETRGLESDNIGDIIVVGSRGMGTTNAEDSGDGLDRSGSGVSKKRRNG